MINSLLFIAILFGFGLLFNRYIVEVLPVAFCFLIGILFCLAFLNMLGLIEIVFIVVLIVIIMIMIRKKIQISAFKVYIKKQLNNPAIYIMLALIVLLTVCLSQRQVSEYDDYKYWAAAVKSLIARNGYEAPHTTFIVSYGDYPQGFPLILWWFERIKGSWNEPILYIGFMIFALSFLLPMCRKFRVRGKIHFFLIVCIFPILIYSISSSYTRFGISLEPDRAMALIYAGALMGVVSEDDYDLFSYIRISLYMVAMVLMKSVGFIWSFFAFSFFLLFKTVKQKRIILKDFATLAAPLIVLIGWNIYCVRTERRAYLTQNMFNAFFEKGNWISIIEERYFIVEMYIRNFLTAALNCVSMVTENTVGINLSPAGFVILFIGLALCIKKMRICTSAEIRMFTGFSVITGIIYHIILLWSYLFMFYDEFSLSNSNHMQNMTSHYAGPFYIGTLLLFSEIILNKNNFTKSVVCYRYAVAIITMISVSSIPLTYTFLWGYRDEKLVNKNAAERQKYRDILAPFILETQIIPDELNCRILFVNTSKDGALRSYLHYFTSPLSVYDIYIDEFDLNKILVEVERSHSNYIYVYNSDIKKKTDNSLGISSNVLYKVIEKNAQIMFVK